MRRSLAALLCLAACASPYQRPELTIGETTLADVVERMGAPSSQSAMTRNGQPIVVLLYTQEAPSEKPHGYDGIIASRTIHLFFHGERLVGHEFSSTVATDHTDFDLRRMRAIEKGKTTREEVAGLLGAPSGYLAFPVVNKAAGEAMLYAYRESRRVPFGAPLTFTKTLVITFDDGGKVNDLVYSTSGTR